MITGTKIGEVAVDSGQIMIIDPCYIEQDFSNQFSGEYENDPKSEYEMNYDGCCKATLNENGYGALQSLAIACRTTWGDGTYPVYAEFNSDGQVTSLTIDFDDQPDYDVCGNCGEELTWDCRCDDLENEDQ